jgi:hypothetical protein
MQSRDERTLESLDKVLAECCFPSSIKILKIIMLSYLGEECSYKQAHKELFFGLLMKNSALH